MKRQRHRFTRTGRKGILKVPPEHQLDRSRLHEELPSPRRPSALRLVERQLDARTVEILRSVLADAISGRAVGVLVAVHYGAEEFGFAGSGSVCETPSIGVAAACTLATRLLKTNI